MLFTCAALVAITLNAPAQTISVSPDDPGNLQAAIAAAPPNATVLVSPGNYSAITVDKPLRLIGTPTFSVLPGGDLLFTQPAFVASIDPAFDGPLVVQGMTTVSALSAQPPTAAVIDYPGGEAWVVNSNLNGNSNAGFVSPNGGGALVSTASITVVQGSSLRAGSCIELFAPPIGGLALSSQGLVVVSDSEIVSTCASPGVVCDTLFVWDSQVQGGPGLPAWTVNEVQSPPVSMRAAGPPSLGETLLLTLSEPISGFGTLGVSTQLRPTTLPLLPPWLFLDPGASLLLPVIAFQGQFGVFVPPDPTLTGLPIVLQANFPAPADLTNPLAFCIQPG